MNTYKRHRFRLGAPHTWAAPRPHFLRCLVVLSLQVEARGSSHRRDAGPLIEDLLAERGISVTRESIRLWCIKFGALYARRLKRKHRGYGDTFFIDEVFVKINGKQHYLWRAVDQDGEVVDVYLQTRRDGAAAKRFFNRLLRSHEATRVRERGMRGAASRRFKSAGQAQRFLGAHAAVHNLFNLGRHLVGAEHYRNLRVSAFEEWGRAVA
jgi:putative transposase